MTAARAIGNDWLVDGGLSAGDRVIVDGLQKVRPGAQVKPVEVSAEQSRTGGRSRGRRRAALRAPP